MEMDFKLATRPYRYKALILLLFQAVKEKNSIHTLSCTLDCIFYYEKSDSDFSCLIVVPGTDEFVIILCSAVCFEDQNCIVILFTLHQVHVSDTVS